jgi:hypothetical protein
MAQAPAELARLVALSWMNLAQFGLYRDLRKLMYRKLTPFDCVLVEAAHL